MTDGFYDRINEFVTRQLSGYKPQKSSDKVIHDPIWGSVLYYGWEIQVIDSPLLQRLRDISQLGSADLTYTAARHSRFEHSLGTAAVAGRMISKLRDIYRDSADVRITNADIYKIRLTAILHDVGHCFYSHLSEGVYSSMPVFREAYDEVVSALPVKVKPKGHEFFSYMIITSPAFVDFFLEYVDFPEKGGREDVERLLHEAANMVIGVPNTASDGTVLSFMTAIINGEFDADKLDYTQRDSYTAGIAMTCGVERFLMKLVVHKNTENGVTDLQLAVDADSLTTVEELIFNRNILYVYMYRHQKVLAAEACIRDIIYGMQKIDMLSHPCDFLEYTDNGIENLLCSAQFPFDYAPKVTLGGLVENVRKRLLPKRCWEISSEKIISDFSDDARQKLAEEYAALPEGEKTAEKLLEFASRYEALSEKNRLIARIRKLVSQAGEFEYDTYTEKRVEFCEKLRERYAKAGKEADFTPLDVHIVLPRLSLPKTSFPIVYKDGRVRNTESIKYLSEWTDSFNSEKWKGYVFCSNAVDKTLASAVAEEMFGAAEKGE